MICNDNFSGLLERGESLADIEKAATTQSKAELKNWTEESADIYHQRFLGAKTSRRELRFKENLAMAEEVIAGTATPATVEILRLQADAQARKSGDESATMDVTAFAQWIVDWKDKSRTVASAIEMFIVDTKRAIDSLERPFDETVQKAFKADVKASAEAKFLALTS